MCSAIRSNIGIAQTMNKDVGHDLITVIGLSPSDVSLTLSLFYVSYIIFDFPSNLAMSRFGPRVWMARIVIATGIIGSCFAAVKAPWSAKYVLSPLTLPIYFFHPDSPPPPQKRKTRNCV